MALLTDTAHRATASHSPVLLGAVSLTKRFGDQQALNDVSFDVRAGELLASLARMAPARLPCSKRLRACFLSTPEKFFGVVRRSEYRRGAMKSFSCRTG